MRKFICIVVSLAMLLTGCSAGNNYKTLFKYDPSKVNADIEKADNLARGYFYDEAIELLKASKYKENNDVKLKITEYEGLKSSLVQYTGKVYHVFFHSLIVYPQLAFDGDYKQAGYDMWMTTVSEFKAMLPQLRERGFVLYPLNQINKPIYLPEGKKPLVISIDDVNYYDYMKGDGFANKLVFNESGDVVTEVITPEGETIQTYDGDVMPILDQFVKENPGFSFRGAKGVVALTGYQGAFGYRITDLEGQELEDARKAVVDISTAMRNNGWLFANHSYTHNNYFQDGNVLLDVLKYDTQRWKDTISPYVGDPDIYISPFGYHLNLDDERLNYLISQGYTTFCPVGKNMDLKIRDNVVIQERFNLDRYNMRAKKEIINKTFFDVDSVYYK